MTRSVGSSASLPIPYIFEPSPKNTTMLSATLSVLSLLAASSVLQSEHCLHTTPYVPLTVLWCCSQQRRCDYHGHPPAL
jgi:hypothetical protein